MIYALCPLFPLETLWNLSPASMTISDLPVLCAGGAVFCGVEQRGGAFALLRVAAGGFEKIFEEVAVGDGLRKYS